MPIRSNLSKVLAAVFVLGASGCGSEVATIEFVSIEPLSPKIGDVTTVTFKLTDYRGTPLAGTNVAFTLDGDDKPGVTITPKSTPSLKGSGLATTQIVVASRPTSVVVVAKAGDKTVKSPPISFAGGGAASGRQFTFQCGQLAGNASGGRHAIGAYDPSRYLIAGVKLQCTAHVADRNGDGVPGAVVSFLTEAGAIGPSDTTVSDVVGNATILYKTSLPLPEEVGPDIFTWTPMLDDTHTGAYLAPLWMEPYTWTTNPIGALGGNPVFNANNLQEPRRPDPFRKKPDGSGFYQNNPRDNLVSLIAFTAGDEGFTDTNNDGIWDKDEQGNDEPFDDLTEPFVDSNDNGTCDSDEKFIDYNGDKKWTAKNGTHDNNVLVWAQDRILWTGVPEGRDAIPPFPTLRSIQSTNGQPIVISCFGGQGVDFVIGDPWFNSLARNSDGDGCKAENGDIVKVAGGDFGTAFTYPPITLFQFSILDALDRKPAPMTNTPGCFPPPGNVCTANGSDCYTFEVPVRCSFTASPLDGYIVHIDDTLRGRIFKNFP